MSCMGKVGSKQVADDFTNDGLAAVLAHLASKGWCDPDSVLSEEGFRQREYKVNRIALDRLAETMRSAGARDAQSKLDYEKLLQFVRTQRHAHRNNINGVATATFELSERARGNLQKLVKRTGRTQRNVVENLLLEGEKTRLKEVKLLREEKREQSRKLSKREGRVKTKEGNLDDREQEIQKRESEFSDFKKEAQPLLELLSDIGVKHKSAGCISAFKPVLEVLREVAQNEGAKIDVEITSYEKDATEFRQSRRELVHHLEILMEEVRERKEF